MGWLLLIPLAAFVILFFRTRKTLRAEEGVNATLRAENESLAQFRDIVDAKAEAERILKAARLGSAEANRVANTAITEAQQSAARLKQHAEQSSAEELSQARPEAKTLRLRAQIVTD